jgi:hypothetical protein
MRLDRKKSSSVLSLIKAVLKIDNRISGLEARKLLALISSKSKIIPKRE